MICFRKRLKETEAKDLLSAAISSDSQDAHLALRAVLNQARAIRPYACHVFIGDSDLVFHNADRCYLSNMFRIRQALQAGKWGQACEDLTGVISCYHVEDARILTDIISTLEEFL